MELNMSLSPSSLSYYLNTLCPLADKVFQFSFVCLLDREEATSMTKNIYQNVVENLPTPGDGYTDLISLIHIGWKFVDRSEEITAKKGEHKIFHEAFGKMRIVNRAVLVAVDFLGLDEEQAAYALDMSEVDLCKSLATARKILISANY
jgi:hypothetical protein